jgi:hypothetical protein
LCNILLGGSEGGRRRSKFIIQLFIKVLLYYCTNFKMTSLTSSFDALTTALARDESISLDMTSIKDLFISLMQDIDELRDDCSSKDAFREKLERECQAKADYIRKINKQLQPLRID